MTLDLIQGAPCLEGLLNFLRAPYFKVPADDKIYTKGNLWGTFGNP